VYSQGTDIEACSIVPRNLIKVLDDSSLSLQSELVEDNTSGRKAKVAVGAVLRNLQTELVVPKEEEDIGKALQSKDNSLDIVNITKRRNMQSALMEGKQVLEQQQQQQQQQLVARLLDLEKTVQAREKVVGQVSADNRTSDDSTLENIQLVRTVEKLNDTLNRRKKMYVQVENEKCTKNMEVGHDSVKRSKYFVESPENKKVISSQQHFNSKTPHRGESQMGPFQNITAAILNKVDHCQSGSGSQSVLNDHRQANRQTTAKSASYTSIVQQHSTYLPLLQSQLGGDQRQHSPCDESFIISQPPTVAKPKTKGRGEHKFMGDSVQAVTRPERPISPPNVSKQKHHPPLHHIATSSIHIPPPPPSPPASQAQSKKQQQRLQSLGYQAMPKDEGRKGQTDEIVTSKAVQPVSIGGSSDGGCTRTRETSATLFNEPKTYRTKTDAYSYTCTDVTSNVQIGEPVTRTIGGRIRSNAHVIQVSSLSIYDSNPIFSEHNPSGIVCTAETPRTFCVGPISQSREERTQSDIHSQNTRSTRTDPLEEPKVPCSEKPQKQPQLKSQATGHNDVNITGSCPPPLQRPPPQNTSFCQGYDKTANKSNEYKIVVLGSSGVGKSALTIRFVADMFLDKHNPVMDDGYRKQVTIDDSPALLDILDITSQEESSSRQDQWLREAKGFLLVYNVTVKQTFEEMERWREKIVGVKEMDNVPIIIIGNKCDLTQSRQVQSKEGQALAQKWGEYCAFFETSAKDKIYIEEVFFEVVRKIRLIEEETGGIIQKQKQVTTSQSEEHFKNENTDNTHGSAVPLSSTPIVWNFQVLGEEFDNRTPV
ncbi:RAS small monomeric GTPase RasA, partial [Reticulomyxa filosa]